MGQGGDQRRARLEEKGLQDKMREEEEEVADEDTDADADGDKGIFWYHHRTRPDGQEWNWKSAISVNQATALGKSTSAKHTLV